MDDSAYLVTAPQSSAPGTGPPVNFTRRYACDRCRGHKLRCIRDQTSRDSPCQRCRKAREKCTISSSSRTAPAQARLNRLSQGNNKPPNSCASPATPVLSAPPQEVWDNNLNDSGQNDQIRLPSVPWIDILDATIIDSTCQSTHDLDFGIARNGVSLAIENHSMTATSHAFLSAPEDFEFGPTFDMSVDHSISGFDKDSGATSQENIQRQHQHSSLSNDSLISNISSLSSISAPAGPSSCSSHSPTWTSSKPAITKPLDNGSSTSVADRKESCIQELTSLSSSLMKDLHRVVGCKLASSFLFTPSDEGPVEYLFRTLDGSTTEESAIGRMLQGSEKFLQIMRLFNDPAQSPPPLDNSLPDDFDFSSLCQGMDDTEASLDDPSERRWRILQSYIDRHNAMPNALSFASWLGNSRLNIGQAQKPDMTFKLVVLTCYTCLLRIYETVFYVVHHTLECAPSLSPSIKLPQTVPGLEINGFLLQNHPTLQIRILIQVSNYMLDSIERTLDGMIADHSFQILLKTVLQQEGLQCCPGNETGMSSVRHLIEKVSGMLK